MAVHPLAPGDPREMGPWTLEARLGSGGMGVVYLARNETVTSALKIIRFELAASPDFVARFRREMDALGRIHSPRVAELVDADPDGEPAWMATEFVDGPTLSEAVEDGPLEGDALHELARGVAEALQAIHQTGVVHRDLKPSNVILQEGRPTVVDFGVASAAEATSITLTGTILGSAGWMSPEQVTGSATVPAIDVFTWASLVTYAATGRPPFGEGRPEAIAYRIIHERADTSALPLDLRRWVDAAFDPDPNRRPTAAGLVSSLGPGDATFAEATAIGATEAVPPTSIAPPAIRPSAPPQEPAPEKKRRGPLVATVLMFLLVLAAIAVAAALLVPTLYDDEGGAEGEDGEDFAAPDPPTTTTTLVSATTVAVRWTIEDFANRDVGESCEADDPFDSDATIALTDGRGVGISGPDEVGAGTAVEVDLPGGLPIPGEFVTGCLYQAEFEDVPVVEGYRVVLNSGQQGADEIEFTADELAAQSWQASITTQVGLGEILGG